MPERMVVVTLTAPGGATTHADDVFDEFTPGQRLRRSAAIFGIALLFTAAIALIPIIHLLGVPLLLITGIVLAVRQLTFAGRLHAVKLACPKCGALNRIGGGLGRRSLAPVDCTCDSCRRVLQLRIDPADAAAVATAASGTS